MDRSSLFFHQRSKDLSSRENLYDTIENFAYVGVFNVQTTANIYKVVD